MGQIGSAVFEIIDMGEVGGVWYIGRDDFLLIVLKSDKPFQK